MSVLDWFQSMLNLPLIESATYVGKPSIVGASVRPAAQCDDNNTKVCLFHRVFVLRNGIFVGFDDARRISALNIY